MPSVTCNHSSNPAEATVFKGSSKGKIIEERKTYDIKETDVLIRVECCGLCYTDVHYRSQDMVLGHEGVGRVEAIGSAVTGYKRGDRVGWGYCHESCRKCQQCLRGEEVFCPEAKMYGAADFDKGGFSTLCPINSEYIFRIPDSLPLKYAAPLMCGGATVFTPLYESAKSTDHIGIVGIGGLGHLAIQFAAKMGCEVTVLSTTDSKKDEAMKLGANHFISTKGVEELSLGEGVRKLDLLLISTSSLPDLEPYFTILAPNASIIPLTVGHPEDMVKYNYMKALMKGVRVAGSIIAPRHIHNLMLDFAARNKVYPMIEVFPLSVQGIENAFEKLEKGAIRYRAVLRNPKEEN